MMYLLLSRGEAWWWSLQTLTGEERSHTCLRRWVGPDIPRPNFGTAILTIGIHCTQVLRPTLRSRPNLRFRMPLLLSRKMVSAAPQQTPWEWAATPITWPNTDYVCIYILLYLHYSIQPYLWFVLGLSIIIFFLFILGSNFVILGRGSLLILSCSNFVVSILICT